MKYTYVAFGFGLILAVGLYLFFVIPMDRPDVGKPVDTDGKRSAEDPPRWSIVPSRYEDVSSDKRGSSDTGTFLTISGTVKRRGRETIEDSVPLTVTVVTLEDSLPEKFQEWLAGTNQYQNVGTVLEAAGRQGFHEDDIQSYLGRRITRDISTNRTGQFELSRAPPGLYRIHRKGRKVDGTGVVLQLRENVRPMTLTLGSTADFEGRVVDSGGSPLEGVRVSFVNDEREPLRTNGNGTFVIQDVPRQRPLNFFYLQKKGYKYLRPDRNSVQDGISDTTFRMRRGTFLRVNVRTSDGNPVGEGAVVVHPGGSFEDLPDPRVSHLRGKESVEFYGLPAGKWSIRLDRGPYVSHPRIVRLAKDDSKTVDLEAIDTQKIVVKVREQGTDSPVRDVRLVARGYTKKGERINLDLQRAGRVGPGEHLVRLPHSASDVDLFVHPRRDPHLRARSVRWNANRDTVTVRLPRISDGGRSIQRRFRWRDTAGREGSVEGGQVEVYHRTSGRRLLQFSPEVLTGEAQSFPEGELLILGYVRSSGEEHVFSTEFGGGTGGDSTVEVKGKTPAELRGTLESGSSDKVRVLGVTPFNPDDYSVGSDRQLSFEIPIWLQERPDEDGTFRFKNLPVDRKLYLVGSRVNNRLGPGAPLHVMESIGPLDSGETIRMKVDSTY